jgi:hypothetical protein
MRKRLRRATLKGSDLPSFSNADVELDGYLQKKSANGKWQRRYFEVAGLFLRYFSEKGSANMKGAIDLTALVKCNGTVDSTFILHLVDKVSGSATQYQLRAESTESMLLWCETLISAKQQKNTMGQSHGNKNKVMQERAEIQTPHSSAHPPEVSAIQKREVGEHSLSRHGKVTVQELAQLRQLKGRLGHGAARWKHRLEKAEAAPVPPPRAAPPPVPPRRRSTLSPLNLQGPAPAPAAPAAAAPPAPPSPYRAPLLPGQLPSLQQVTPEIMEGWSNSETEHFIMTTALELCNEDVNVAFELTQEFGDSIADFVAAARILEREREREQEGMLDCIGTAAVATATQASALVL